MTSKRWRVQNMILAEGRLSYFSVLCTSYSKMYLRVYACRACHGRLVSTGSPEHISLQARSNAISNLISSDRERFFEHWASTTKNITRATTTLPAPFFFGNSKPKETKWFRGCKTYVQIKQYPKERGCKT